MFAVLISLWFSCVLLCFWLGFCFFGFGVTLLFRFVNSVAWVFSWFDLVLFDLYVYVCFLCFE